MKKIDKQFWHNKRVFITGHTGFKGSWFSQWLLLLGAEVHGYSLKPPTNPNLFEILTLDNEMGHTIGDICDFECLSKALMAFKPDVVVHLAAQPLVRLSYNNPRLTYETNVMGTFNVYEAVRLYCPSVRVIVSITTDKCYENNEWVWGYRENDPMGGHDPYSSSKGCAELLSAAYRNSFFNIQQYGKTHNIALATARAGNVIGGGDWAEDRLVPDCMRALALNEEISIRSPNAIRPWQHVLEPLAGYLQLTQALWNKPKEFSGAWNFGPNDDGMLRVEEVVQKLIKLYGSGRYVLTKDADLHEAQLLKLDISKSRFLLHWEPQFDISQALSSTITWYKNFYEDKSILAKELTIKQIEDYEE